MGRTRVAYLAIWIVIAAACSGHDAGTGSSTTVPDHVRSYVSLRPTSPIVVDGKLNEAAWNTARWTDPFVDIRGQGFPTPAYETRAAILWDEQHLYIGARLEEPHLWGTLTERDAIVYHDHDFEVFLDPDGDGLAYYEFEVNALGTMFDLFLDRPYSRDGTADISWNVAGLLWAVDLDGTVNDPLDTDRGWTVEIAIPFAGLIAPGATSAGRPPVDGEVWRVNFSRVQWPLTVVDGVYRKTREPENWDDHPEENWVWSPQGEINLHLPEHWGAVTFREADASGGPE